MTQLSAKTIKGYENCIKRLKLKNISINGTITVDQIYEILTTDNMDNGVISIYLCAILWELRKNTTEDNDFMISVTKKITELTNITKEHINKNICNEKEKGKYIPWHEILDIYAKLEQIKNNSKKDYSNYLIFSLYILIPPRRILDYSEMHILFDFDETYINKELSDTFDQKNYYVYYEHKFIFNNFKTNRKYIPQTNSSKYKQQVFTIPDALNEILTTYIDKYNIKGSLFNISDKAFICRLRKIFSTYTGRSLSANSFRHSFIIYEKNRGELKDKESMSILASKMAHSIDLQQDYYKKDV